MTRQKEHFLLMPFLWCWYTFCSSISLLCCLCCTHCIQNQMEMCTCVSNLIWCVFIYLYISESLITFLGSSHSKVVTAGDSVPIFLSLPVISLHPILLYSVYPFYWWPSSYILPFNFTHVRFLDKLIPIQLYHMSKPLSLLHRYSSFIQSSFHAVHPSSQPHTSHLRSQLFSLPTSPPLSFSYFQTTSTHSALFNQSTLS